MRMRPRRSTALLGLLVGGVVVLGLSACTPTAPSPTTTPGAGASTAPAASAAPTPTVAALAPPQVRVPLTCDQVAPTAQLTAALGSNIVPQTDRLSDLTPYAYKQDGALYCAYKGTVAKSDTEYQLVVMPDVAAKVWNGYKKYLSEASTITSPFGANSYVDCESSPKDLKCNFDMLIGTTWLTIENFSDNVPNTITTAQALARFTPAIQSAVTAVQGATIAEPLWTDPDATAVNISDSTAFNTLLRTASGIGYTTEVYNPDLVGVGPESVAMIPTGFQLFGGGGGNFGANVSVLPGGLWAYGTIATAASSLPGYATQTGLGDQAFSFSETGTYEPWETTLVVAKGHNLVMIEVDTTTKSSSSKVAGVAQKLAAAVLTKIN